MKTKLEYINDRYDAQSSFAEYTDLKELAVLAKDMSPKMQETIRKGIARVNKSFNIPRGKLERRSNDMQKAYAHIKGLTAKAIKDIEQIVLELKAAKRDSEHPYTPEVSKAEKELDKVCVKHGLAKYESSYSRRNEYADYLIPQEAIEAIILAYEFKNPCPSDQGTARV